jgi:hypothetical protein
LYHTILGSYDPSPPYPQENYKGQQVGILPLFFRREKQSQRHDEFLPRFQEAS